MAIFKGAGVAIVTPMYEDGKVNYDKLEELLELSDCKQYQMRSLSAEQQENHQR